MDSALPYRFHPIIANTYTEVHSWLQNLPKAQTYNQKNIRNKIDHLLSESSMLSAAAQFYIYFPAHFFKVTHAFENSVGVIKLLEWLKYNPRICIVDVGCGAGAASASFIDMLLKLYDDNLLSRPIELFLIGIDINPYAIALYDKYMTGLKRRMTNYDIKIDYRLIPHGDYQATNRLQNFLNEKRNFWQQPYISQILIMQVNVVSPFSQRFNSTQSQLTELAELDIDIEMLGDYHEVFGREEALAYRQLMENVAIDHLNIFTIGTQGWENRVGEMAAAIDQQFSSESHRVERLGSGQHRVNYVLPEGCYWTDWKSTKEYHSDFRLDVSVVSNTELEDADWNAIVNIENLKLAWARARRHLQDQVLVDEVEIRLFEIDLEYNLSWLQKQLEAYAADVIHSEDRVLYHFPKSTGSTRPRGLSRIEEEILSTALVQKLGQKIVGLTSRSYAYRFSRNYGESNTEYLYEYWFESYSRYINHARQEVLKHEKCAVIQTDIRSFYTKIIQEQLIEIATDRLSRSSRFEWLLRTLLIDDLESHEAGRGIIQGNLGSGFYANLYLVDLDAYFSVNNEWNAEYFRYVDDIIVVIPNSDHAHEVLKSIQAKLEQLNLELNTEKTEIYLNREDFLSDTAPDEYLDELQLRFDQIINPVWIMNPALRSGFRKKYNGANEEWWYLISSYKFCLDKIGVYTHVSDLSRKVYAYIFNQIRCQEDLHGNSELLFAALPEENQLESLNRWQIEFSTANVEWFEKKNLLAAELSSLVNETWGQIGSLNPEDGRELRILTRRLRFAINRLLQLGLLEVSDSVVDILCSSPWLYRDPANVIEGLAQQGLTVEVLKIIEYYSSRNNVTDEYMTAASIRALRSFDEITPELWDQLIIHATNQSVAVSLLATETWLALGTKVNTLVRDDDIRKIEDTLKDSVNLIPRLRKNYLLILGKYGNGKPLSYVVNDDLVSRQAQDIVMSGNVSSLFNYFEPNIIRQTFYSGFRTSEDDQLDMMVSY